MTLQIQARCQLAITMCHEADRQTFTVVLFLTPFWSVSVKDLSNWDKSISSGHKPWTSYRTDLLKDPHCELRGDVALSDQLV